MTTAQHRRAYYAGKDESPSDTEARVLGALVGIVGLYATSQRVRVLAYRDGAYSFPDYVINALWSLEKRHLVERMPGKKVLWRATEAGVAAHILGPLDPAVEGASMPEGVA